jgi:hypothetical protein
MICRALVLIYSTENFGTKKALKRAPQMFAYVFLV